MQLHLRESLVASNKIPDAFVVTTESAHSSGAGARGTDSTHRQEDLVSDTQRPCLKPGGAMGTCNASAGDSVDRRPRARLRLAGLAETGSFHVQRDTISKIRGSGMMAQSVMFAAKH